MSGSLMEDHDRKPLTMADVETLRAADLHDVADVAARYAVDRPLRWWQIPSNRRPYPNATFGTVRYFWVAGVVAGWALHWAVMQLV